MFQLLLITIACLAAAAVLWRVSPRFRIWLVGNSQDKNAEGKKFGGTIYTYSFTDSAGERHVRDFARPLTPIEAEKIAAHYKRRSSPVSTAENVDN